MSGEVKKLHRSTDDRWLAGVCGGLAKYFNVDPTLMRVIFVILALIGLGGVIIYLVLWVIIPPEPTEEEQAMMDNIIDEEIVEDAAGEEEAE